MAPKRRSGDPIAYLEKKHQTMRPSPLSQVVSLLDDYDDNGADCDARFDVETEDSSEAVDRWQELKAAKTEDEEIARFNREQIRARTESERNYNAALHEVRMKRMQARKIEREAKQTAAQSQGAAQEPALEVNTSAKKGKGKDETSAAHLAAGTHKKPRRTDLEVLPDAEWERSPPHSTPWRNAKRERGPLNIDQSRIETEFILSNEFIDDVNTMLDFVAGLPKEQFEDIRYAFKKDNENQNRRVEFAHVGAKKWTIRLLKLDSQESNKVRGPADVYTLDDLPDDCRKLGCVDGCPSTISFEDQMRNFRYSLKRNRPLDVMAEACRLAGPAFGVLPDSSSMPPPPIPPRFNKRKMPPTPRPNNRELPNTRAQVNQLRQTNSYWQNRIRQHKMIASGQLPPNTPAIVREDSILDLGPLGGKLKHVDRIPTGPNSIRLEEYMLTSAFDKRSKVPELKDENIRNKPRKTYYAKRAPSKSDSDDESSGSPPPAKTKQPASDFVDLSSSTTTQIIDARPRWGPRWERDPDGYYKWQAAKAELISRERSRQNASKILTSVPDKGAMTHLRRGLTIETPPLHEQPGRRRIFHRAFASEPQFRDPAAARRLSESSPVFEWAPPEEPTIMIPTTPPDSPPPSLRRTDSNDDISVWGPDEHFTAPDSPRIRDDMELDGDIPLDEEPAKSTGSETRQEFSQSALDAYQQHIRRKMSELTSRMNAIATTPGGANVGVRSDSESNEPVDGKRKGKAKYTKE